MRALDRFVGYNRDLFRKDLIAGLIVGMIAIPLGMAFAIAVGVKPEYGLYTTIIAGIIIALFGGTRFQIGGPTGAFVPVLLAIVLQYGYKELLIAGFLSGILLIMMGLLRVGKAIQFIPRPVTIGFTAGIAVLIFSGQIPNVLGLGQLEKHEYFLLNMKEILLHLSSVHFYSLLTAIICFLVIMAVQRWLPKIPGSFIGMIASAVIAMLLFPAHVETIRTAYGAIPSALPKFQWLDIQLHDIRMMLFPALTIALLGGIESLLSAVVADRMSGTAHNSNRELVGQGLANMAVPLFGGIPATGAIARTAANIKNGAASPIAAVIHGLFVLLVVMLFARWASEIPLASMAPILMIVAWNMSERKEFSQILKAKTTDSLLLISTFVLTVLTDLVTAIWIGMAAAIVFYLLRMVAAHVRTLESSKELNVLQRIAKGWGQVFKNASSWYKFQCKVMRASDSGKISEIAAAAHSYHQQTGMHVKLQGAMSFISAPQVKEALLQLASSKPGFIQLDMSEVPYIDTTGEALLHSFIQYVQGYGGKLLLIDPQMRTKGMLQQADKQGVIRMPNQ
ncbi:SulP family inorganic anion transporter [Paenibacillus sp. GXUN7292]|uniref:SulP family inorganic anion transporter n=1 Tax=Paenibacillus sp. GXUN7292 TaxID=3422499 RepID=UPI003D7E2D64